MADAGSQDKRPLKLLVLATDYPRPDGYVSLYYIHSRNLYYASHGMDVTVLNFRTDVSYELDGIKVISPADYRERPGHYDRLISHAPNLRNHYAFLKKHRESFPQIIFVFHGHEIMRMKDYPEPFDYVKGSIVYRSSLRNLYDSLKFKVWRRFFVKYVASCRFIFVSNMLREVFYRNLRIDTPAVRERTAVIPNSVGAYFETHAWDKDAEKVYDLITIRTNYDLSTYSVDLLAGLASANPRLSFLLIGKGEYFEHYEQPANLTIVSEHLSHQAIADCLDQSRCGLMLTRHDTQGLMSCEMATYGIPLLTSDIAICREVFAEFTTVGYLSNEANEAAEIDLEAEIARLERGPGDRNMTYSAENTVKREMEIIRRFEN